MNIFRRFPGIRLCWLWSLIVCAALVATVRADTELAYIYPSVGAKQNSEIRKIKINGRGDRNLVRLSSRIPKDSRIGNRIEWSPSGNEVVFDSGHAVSRSLYTRDVYAVHASGKRYRRVTNYPDPSSFKTRPRGKVKVTVDGVSRGVKMEIYVEGALRPVVGTVRRGPSFTVTVPGVADFGRNVRQYVRVRTNRGCAYDVGAFADVIPGKTVNAGSISSFLPDTCPKAFSPSWQSDGKQIYYLLHHDDNSLQTKPIDIYAGHYRPRRWGSKDRSKKRILDYTDVLGGSSGFPFGLTMSPFTDRDRRRTMLWFEESNYPSGASAIIADAADPLSRQFLSLPCPVISCDRLDVAWLPNPELGFIYSHYSHASVADRGEFSGGAIVEVNGDTEQTTTILELSDEAIGEIDISSDGKIIAFTRGARLDPSSSRRPFGPEVKCPCDIWLVNRDGTDLRRLKRNARGPDWRPRGR